MEKQILFGNNLDVGLLVKDWWLCFLFSLLLLHKQNTSIYKNVYMTLTKTNHLIFLLFLNESEKQLTYQFTLYRTEHTKKEGNVLALISTETSATSGVEKVQLSSSIIPWMKICSGSSSNTCSEEYRGQSAFSEPESRAVRNFIQGRRGSIKMYLTFHSYGQMFLYPWGYDSSVRAR